MLKKILTGLVILLALFVLFYFYASNTTTVVSIHRTFSAPVEKVWQLWNDPEIIKQYWGPHGYSCPVAKNDVREGGSFLLGMQGPDGKIVYNAGTYTEVIPNQKMVSKLWFSDENGNKVSPDIYGIPGKWADDVNVTMEFKGEGDKTHLTITEVGMPTLMSVFAKMGWEQQFEKFEKLLR